jgi:predicted amidohydrolase
MGILSVKPLGGNAAHGDTSVRIALCQLPSSPEKEENCTAARRAIAEARGRGADLVLLPEVFMAYLDRHSPVTPGQVAEPLDGPFVSALAREARAHRLYVACGVWETALGEAARAFNTAVLLGPDGDVLLAYRKTHLYDAFGFRESDRIVPGGEPPRVVRTPLGVLGLLICYEIRFPELPRLLALAGAEVLLVPAAWVAGPLKEDHWTTLLRARALENTVYVAASDQVGPVFVGRSMLVDPLGVIVAGAGEDPGLVLGEVDLERIATARDRLPLLQQRREEIYSPLSPPLPRSRGAPIRPGGRRGGTRA